MKVKRVRTIDCVVVGWRPGKEEGTVGSLILGLYDDGDLRVVGHSSGFKAKEKRELVARLAPYETGEQRLRRPSRWTGRPRARVGRAAPGARRRGHVRPRERRAASATARRSSAGATTSRRASASSSSWRASDASYRFRSDRRLPQPQLRSEHSHLVHMNLAAPRFAAGEARRPPRRCPLRRVWYSAPRRLDPVDARRRRDRAGLGRRAQGPPCRRREPSRGRRGTRPPAGSRKYPSMWRHRAYPAGRRRACVVERAVGRRREALGELLCRSRCRTSRRLRSRVSRELDCDRARPRASPEPHFSSSSARLLRASTHFVDARP